MTRKDSTAPSADSPNVIVFPPLLFGGMLAIGLIVHFMFPFHPFPGWPARIAGSLMLVAGATLVKWGEITMKRAGTNIHPGQPSLALVVDGPFRFSRNPLYLALTLFYLGITLLANALYPLILLVPLLTVLRWGIVLREERYLEAKFGDAYRDYRSRVRRWI